MITFENPPAIIEVIFNTHRGYDSQIVSNVTIEKVNGYT